MCQPRPSKMSMMPSVSAEEAVESWRSLAEKNYCRDNSRIIAEEPFGQFTWYGITAHLPT